MECILFLLKELWAKIFLFLVPFRMDGVWMGKKVLIVGEWVQGQLQHMFVG
jgi:hypothetical protein